MAEVLVAFAMNGYGGGRKSRSHKNQPPLRKGRELGVKQYRCLQSKMPLGHFTLCSVFFAGFRQPEFKASENLKTSLAESSVVAVYSNI